ncbi:alpha-hydroxy-acid oxidizing protein [Roseobacter denitrificans]|uniref:L-lactate dehydrogenase (Cytochrome), putative n=1 Tax=Roseobacter denitrificans (strain ATCC 33942 / OCh 114) TaxID=375451 RepID=Q161R5_ROSDO|nr:alpha-hydroxy acid oxidase [Roseobacter denitrificans]ABG33278.1 L-lactate dehydrogenase (Cytochrome), putative [Roseobacter denitrificans OCh 114]AVL52618.1 alpha-hydroxy-acid oxidizing protein [Roseobacter denitrificans]SFG22032.1 L-lactate dehydrogenase (cytochrome) [Roseobacter denitrificans OCh 114]
MGATIHSYDDARRIARRRLPWMVFDYIDGAAGNGVAEARNLAALRDVELQPRVLRNVARRDIGVQVFEHAGQAPFGISPMGMCNLSGPGADVMLARIAAKHQVPVGVSTVASTSLETMIEEAQGHAWFQLYFSGDGSGTAKLVERAKAAGYKTLIMTLDVPEVGRRPRELRRGFKMPFKIGPMQFIDFALHPRWSLSSLMAGAPDLANFQTPEFTFDRTESRAAADWDFLKRLRDSWDGHLVAKGVTDVVDALRLKAQGVDAIQVSTHGGRQLDSAPPPILALKRIRDAIGPQYPLFYDTGMRSGEDVVKAYQMGADFVFFGRAMQFAIAAGGRDGLAQYWDLLADEVSLTLAQMGLTTLPINRDVT